MCSLENVVARGRRVVSRFSALVAGWEAEQCGGTVIPEKIEGKQYYSVYVEVEGK